VQGVLFSDAGAWRTAGGNFDDFVNPDYFRHFVGPGFRVMYKRAYNAVFRLDYGVDIYEPGERGVVVGFGQYF
jgi:outer membrane protein insertion porin family